MKKLVILFLLTSLSQAHLCVVGPAPSAIFPRSFTLFTFDNVDEAPHQAVAVKLVPEHWQYGAAFAKSVAVFQALKKSNCDTVIISSRLPEGGYVAEQAKRSGEPAFTCVTFIAEKYEDSKEPMAAPGSEEAVSSYIKQQGQVLADYVWDTQTHATLPSKWMHPLPCAAAPVEEQEPLVSVVVVTHNRPIFLKECIESLRTQSYKRIQVVLVDDASTTQDAQDVLAELAPEFEARHWTIIKQESSTYLGAARNRGVQSAKGDLIMFLDDDDVALPHMVQTLVKAIRVSSIAVSGHIVWKSGAALTNASSVWLPVGPVPTGGALGRNFVGSASFMIRKTAFAQLRGFSTERSAWEDFEFHSRAVAANVSYAVVPEPLMLYRMHSKSQMSVSADVSKNFARIQRLYGERSAQVERATVSCFTYVRNVVAGSPNTVVTITVTCARVPVYLEVLIPTVSINGILQLTRVLLQRTGPLFSTWTLEFTTPCNNRWETYQVALTGETIASASFRNRCSHSPTKAPTKAPTRPPTKAPTKAPTRPPTKAPTKAPTRPPTKAPTRPPTTGSNGNGNGNGNGNIGNGNGNNNGNGNFGSGNGNSNGNGNFGNGNGNGNGNSNGNSNGRSTN